LRRMLPVAPMRGDHFYARRRQAGIQTVTVIGFVANQVLRQILSS
jgi:hypothetical protein